MDASDIIQIISIVVSSLASCIGIWISLKALKQSQITNEQSNKMLEASVRPYITIYIDTLTICEQCCFFVLKNFGNSPALITKFEYDPLLKQTTQKYPLFQKQFDFVENLTLAPSQSKLLQYDVSKLPADEITFKICYLSNGNEYNDTIKMNIKNFIHIPVSRNQSHIPKGNERQVLILQEMLERFM